MENPVLNREFLTSVRTRKAVALGIGFVWLLALVVVLMWPPGGTVSLASQSSHDLFTLLAMGQLALVVLVAPAFTAVSITVEKEQSTYDLLYHTLLRSHQIVAGKLTAGVGFVLILLLLALPMMGACLILGGVGWSDVARCYGILLVSAAFFGLLGLVCSAAMRSSYRALIFCYMVTLAIALLTWVPSIILGRWANDIVCIHLLRALSPFAAMVSVVNPELFAAEHAGAATGLVAFADTIYPYLVAACGGIVLLLLAVMWLVARPPQPRHRRTGAADEGRKKLLKRFPFRLFNPERRTQLIGPVWNIIAVKEMRTKAFARAIWIIRAMYAAIIASLVLTFVPLWQVGYVDVPVIMFLCLSLPLGLIVLVCPVLTSSGISEEIENGVFEALRMTPVSAVRIVLGKLEVAWFFVLLLVGSTFPAFFALAFIGAPAREMEKLVRGLAALGTEGGGSAWSQLMQVDASIFVGPGRALLVIAASVVFVTVLGLAVSSFLRRSSLATAVAYGLVVAYAFGTLLPYFAGRNLPAWVIESILVINPFVAAGKAVSPAVVLPEVYAGLWADHLIAIVTASLLLFAAATWRVRSLMLPGE
jgi:ABC-type transport system involved in multi-copper enzyme maturation permease subunit